MDNAKRDIQKFSLKQYVNFKILMGGVLIVLGGVLTFKADSTTASDINAIMANLLDAIMGSLIIVIGLGLIVLGVSDKKQEEKDSINIFIGKQLFEKGLQGVVLGVLVTILSAGLEMISRLSEISQ